MRILLTGATGLIGPHLVQKFIEQGLDDWVFLGRSPGKLKQKFDFPARVFRWNPKKEPAPVEAFEGVEAVIHLAGENIAGLRWSEQKKKEIYESRIVGTKNLLKGIELAHSQGRFKSTDSPIPLLCASGAHYYGDRGEEILKETSSAGPYDHFLSRVCQDWESSFLDPALPSTHFRRAVFRFGVVLSPDGGALKTMLPAFQLGLAGKLGPGKQYMPWIHLQDLLQLLKWALENVKVHGHYNAVTPYPITNAEFTQAMGRVLRRPTLIPAPAFLLKALLGEMSQLLLDSQRVMPMRAMAEGFQFNFPHIQTALEDLLTPQRKGQQEFLQELWLAASPTETFQFFADAKNLEMITPPSLNFKILSHRPTHMEKGTIIHYTLKIRGIPVRWKTLISDWVPERSFTDVQLKGPYSEWIHTHQFFPFQQGTLIRDTVTYKIPGSWPGRLLLGPLIKRDLVSIFNYRKKQIQSSIKRQGPSADEAVAGFSY